MYPILSNVSFYSSFGFSASDTLKEDSILPKKNVREVQEKLMTYE